MLSMAETVRKVAIIFIQCVLDNQYNQKIFHHLLFLFTFLRFVLHLSCVKYFCHCILSTNSTGQLSFLLILLQSISNTNIRGHEGITDTQRNVDFTSERMHCYYYTQRIHRDKSF